jgi:predicted ATPase/DNA-binding CsgD family transcriptional regulator/transcriptional regulator with XRE-family HTH domain
VPAVDESRPDVSPAGLRQARLDLRLSQAALGEALGVTPNTVARWERGERPIRHPALVRLALERLRTPSESPISSASGSPLDTILPTWRPSTRPPPLPAEVSSFVGRDQAIQSVQACLNGHRLVTLVGPGGVGKTRLALRVATQVQAEYADGAALVDFSALSDAGLVAQTVASTLGIWEPPGMSVGDALTASLHSRHLLLVLDNCEQVLPAAADLVRRLLGACALLRVLCTSREPLGIDSEVVWLVPPLAEADAAELFTERARAASPEFCPDASTQDGIKHICTRLDRIPLAIELAARRIRVFSLPELALRLDDRFSLLTSTSQIAPPRQLTLYAALDWSYQLLGSDERMLLDRLSVFSGAWSVEAMTAVCSGDGLEPEGIAEVLARLVDKSLVVVESREAGRRYRLLESIRDFAAAHLAAGGELATWRERHCDWYCAFAERTPAARLDPRPAELERDNLRAALRWCIDTGNAEAGLRLAIGVWTSWYLRGTIAEGSAWLDELLGLQIGLQSSVVRATALRRAGYLAYRQGDRVQAEQRIQQSLAMSHLLNDLQGVAESLHFLGVLASGDAARALARSLFEEARQINQHLGSDVWEAANLTTLVDLALADGDHARALELAQVSLPIFQRREHRWGVAYALYQLGQACVLRGDVAAAEAWHAQSLELQRQLAFIPGILRSSLALGRLAVRQSDWRRAREHLLECVRLAYAESAWAELAASLDALGTSGRVRDPQAVQLAAAAAELRNAHAIRVTPAERTARAEWQAHMRRRLGSDGFGTNWLMGRILPLGQIVELADSSAREDASAGILTRREVEVLELVASGCTNKQIAERLVVSPKTVSRHMDNIFQKLGVSTRAAAIARSPKVGYLPDASLESQT